jgi:hypothetical protein
MSTLIGLDLINFVLVELVQILMRVDESFRHARAVISSQLVSSTLMQLFFSFDRGMRVETDSHTNSRFSTLVQLLFSFDRSMRVEKTLRMQTLASQLIYH